MARLIGEGVSTGPFVIHDNQRPESKTPPPFVLRKAVPYPIFELKGTTGEIQPKAKGTSHRFNIRENPNNTP